MQSLHCSNDIFGACDNENEAVAQVGDIGDRVVHSKRCSDSVRTSLSARHIEVVPVSPSHEEMSPSFLTNAVTHSESKQLDDTSKLPWSLEYASWLLHLAVFGILGVLTRYLLKKFVGPRVAGMTANNGILYLDLPSNVVGSFLMGWFGVVFKGDISSVSNFLAVGLTSGYLGSLTTFSGWNQDMVELSVNNHWVRAVIGFSLGLFFAELSIAIGIWTANFLRWVFRRLKLCSRLGKLKWRVESMKQHVVMMVVMMAFLVILMGLSVALQIHEFRNGGDRAQLWLACLVGPLGVWLRWFLARMNGMGIGKSEYLKWFPLGTLAANILACSAMAGIASAKLAVKRRTFDTIGMGLQFGIPGCLSTVSTFIAEFDAMWRSRHPWRACAYAGTTIVMSFAFATLLYSVPVWIKGWKSD